MITGLRVRAMLRNGICQSSCGAVGGGGRLPLPAAPVSGLTGEVGLSVVDRSMNGGRHWTAAPAATRRSVGSGAASAHVCLNRGSTALGVLSDHRRDSFGVTWTGFVAPPVRGGGAGRPVRASHDEPPLSQCRSGGPGSAVAPGQGGSRRPLRSSASFRATYGRHLPRSITGVCLTVSSMTTGRGMPASTSAAFSSRYALLASCVASSPSAAHMNVWTRGFCNHSCTRPHGHLRLRIAVGPRSSRHPVRRLLPYGGADGARGPDRRHGDVQIAGLREVLPVFVDLGRTRGR